MKYIEPSSLAPRREKSPIRMLAARNCAPAQVEEVSQLNGRLGTFKGGGPASPFEKSVVDYLIN
jgi:hypothetical protein